MTTLFLKLLALGFKLLKQYWWYLLIAGAIVVFGIRMYNLAYDRGARSRDPEVVALEKTIADVRTKTAEAALADAENARRIEAEYAKEREAWDATLRDITASNATALDKLRGQIKAGAYTGSGGTAPVSGNTATADGSDGASAGNGLYISATKLDRLAQLIGECQRNTDKLVSLRGWGGSLAETP